MCCCAGSDEVSPAGVKGKRASAAAALYSPSTLGHLRTLNLRGSTSSGSLVRSLVTYQQ